MKNLGFFLVMAILFGCNQKEFNDPPSDSKVSNEQKLSTIREITKNFIPNPDSAKFRNQIGDCGEVSYMEKPDSYSSYSRFVVIDENIVLIEHQIDSNQFELSWNSSCIRSWK